MSVVSFTGSTHVGRLVNQNAAPAFKKVHLEMGGKNVIMIMDDAQSRAGGRGLPVGRVRDDGTALHGRQPRGRSREGLRRVRRRSSSRARRRCVSATGWTKDRDGPMVSEAQLETVMRYVEIGRRRGDAGRAAHRADGGAHAQGSSTSRRSSPTSSRRCESRRRRSSVRWCR